MNLAELAPYFSNEDKALELVESLVWPDGTICPHCGGVEKAYRIKSRKVGTKTRPGLWKCGQCRQQFTVKVGTIFEGSHIPMTKWLLAIYMMCGSKKGISYKSAWFLCHRIRYAMTQEPLKGKLGSGGGIVEIDETFVGGKEKNNKHRRKPESRACKKTAVMTLVDREGAARTFKVPNTRKGTLQAIAIPNIDGTAHIITDEWSGYEGIEKHFASHHTVNHSETFVRALIFHTNFAESYHSLLKRSIFGAYHHVSAKHLPRYLREREFCWNLRHATDGQRAVAAIKGAKGRRLMYRAPTGGRSLV